MKKWLAITIMSVFTAGSCLASGGLGVFGSYWDAKDADDTIGFGAVLRVPLNQSVQLEIRGSFYNFDEKDDLEGERIEADLDVIPIEAGLIVRLSDAAQFTPYVGGGIGYYFADADIQIGGQKVNFDIDDEIGFYAVAGLEVGLSASLALFAEAKYTWLEFEKAKIDVPGLGSEKVDFDLKMDGLGVNVGLILRW